MSRLPSLSAKDLIKALLKAGFIMERQKGSHLRLYHPVNKRQTVVPMHSGDVPRGLLKGIIKQAGLTEEEFRNLL